MTIIINVYVYVQIGANGHRCSKKPEASDTLELELQTDMGAEKQIVVLCKSSLYAHRLSSPKVKFLLSYLS